MATIYTSVPTQQTVMSILPRNIFFTDGQGVGVYDPATYNTVISGALSRDSGSSNVSLLRAGLIMGKVTATGANLGKYAPSIIGVTTATIGGGATTLNVNAAMATELVRRVGATGTFNITGPATAGGVATTQLATYSAVNTTTGNITISALFTAAINAVNAVEAVPFVDSTGSGTFTLTIEGITTGAITYSATAATLVTNINTALNSTFGTSAIVASGASLSAQILTFSGTGYAGRPIGNSSNGTVSGVKVIATLLTGATAFTAGNNPTSSGVGPTLAGGSTTTTAGVTAVAAKSGEFVAGSIIQPTDGSQNAISVLDQRYGIDVVSVATGLSIDQIYPRFLKQAALFSSQLVNFIADDFGNAVDTGTTAFIQAMFVTAFRDFTYNTQY